MVGFLANNLLSHFLPTAGKAGVWEQKKQAMDGTQRQGPGTKMGRDTKTEVRMRTGMGHKDEDEA